MSKNNQGYNGNASLNKAGVTEVITAEEKAWRKAELRRCKNDPIYFMETYIRVVSLDEGFVPFTLYPYQKNIVNSMHNNRNTIIATARQVGKAVNVKELIPLFQGGFVTMENLKVGDVVIGNDGKPTNVTYKSPVHYRPTFRITFDDGTTKDVCEDHLWEVYDRFEGQNRRPHKREVISTKEMYVRGWKQVNKTTGYDEYRWYIPNTKPVEYEERSQLADPYIVGLWLGDGSSANRYFQLTNEALNFYNLRNNKHIPDDYMYGSVEQRTNLLQGLMDADGFIEKNGLCCIQLSSRYPQLIDDVEQLLCGLGLKVTRSNHIDKKQGKTSVRLAFTCDKQHLQVSRIARKNERQKDVAPRRCYSLSRTIQNIELIETIATQCITVDNESHLYLIGREYLPTHNTTSAVGYVLWYIIFNKVKTVGILANKGDTSRKILASIKQAFELLPMWIKPGVKEWNKGNIELENSCKVLAAATSSDAIRGQSINMLIIDEAAHIENWSEFFTSVYPTISSGKKTKVILISTPNGLNDFYGIWDNAEKKNNDYHPIKVMWYEAPGRDEAWRQKTLADLNYDEQKFAQEYEVEFIGSSGTLINGGTLKALQTMVEKPKISRDHLNIYREVEKDHKYIIVADTSRGKGLDYSAFQCIDITATPYIQVATFRDNMTLSPDYAAIIYRIAKQYNNAHVLVEINDLGQQVVDILHENYEYEYILKTTIKGRGGKQLSTGFGGNSDRGIRTTTQVKATGCAMLKMLVEQRQLLLVDDETRKELNTFSKKGNSYEAEPGNHDDLTMGLVLFAWASDQKFFKELTDSNIVDSLKEISDEQLYGDLVSTGIIFVDGLDGRGDPEEEWIDYSLNPDPFSWF